MDLQDPELVVLAARAVQRRMQFVPRTPDTFLVCVTERCEIPAVIRVLTSPELVVVYGLGGSKAVLVPEAPLCNWCREELFSLAGDNEEVMRDGG